MINMQVNVDVDSFTRDMDDTQQRQIPFAVKNGLNAVTLDVQVAERQHLRDVFTLRREAWADRSIKITHFATKTEQYSTIAIEPPGGGDKGGILGKFEDQTEKLPFNSAHGIAVPIDAGRTRKDIIKDGQKPKAFGLHDAGNGRVVGTDGTYIVKLANGRQLLLQRKDLGVRAAKKLGRGTAERATLLFIFVPRVKIAPNLHFVDTAEQVVEQMWARRMGDALEQALGTAR
jgi:hypothetical protein